MTTVDKTEIEKFSKMAEDWWNPDGKFKPLHIFNPTCWSKAGQNSMEIIATGLPKGRYGVWLRPDKV